VDDFPELRGFIHRDLAKRGPTASKDKEIPLHYVRELLLHKDITGLFQRDELRSSIFLEYLKNLLTVSN
jgi:hypothetical protein